MCRANVSALPPQRSGGRQEQVVGLTVEQADQMLGWMEIAYNQPLVPLALDAIIKTKMLLAEVVKANNTTSEPKRSRRPGDADMKLIDACGRSP